MERCPNCGASIRTGARFCTSCGFRLLQPTDGPVVSSSSEPSPSSDSPVVGTVISPSGDSSAPEPGRVIWHGDPRSITQDESDASATEFVPSGASSGVVDSPDLPSDGASTARPHEAGSDPAFRSWPTASADGQTGTEASADAPTVDNDSDDPSSNDDGLLAATEEQNQQESVSGEAEHDSGSATIDDERLEIEAAPIESVPSDRSDSDLIASSSPGGADTPDDLAMSGSMSVTDTSDDQLPPVIETPGAESEVTDVDSGAGARDVAETDEVGEPESDAPGRGAMEDASPRDDQSNESSGQIEADTSAVEPPTADPGALQDDVVIDTSFMAETDQPGYYDANGERPSLTGEIERTPDHESAGPDGSADDSSRNDGAGPAGIEAIPLPTPVSTEPDTSSGRDDEYEPWGSGGAIDPDAAADRPGQANGLPIAQGDQDPGEPASVQAGIANTTGIDQARLLLEQLRATIDSLEHSATQPVTDPGAELAIESMAEIGQILDALPSSTIESDRLAELTRLAEDLTGRDYDIRALQRFAQERETILTLATEVQRHRDVVDQIRSILAQSRP